MANQIEGLDVITDQAHVLSDRVANLEQEFAVLSASTGSGKLSGSLGESSGIDLTSPGFQGLATASADLNVGGNSVINGMLSVLKLISTPNLMVSDFASLATYSLKKTYLLKEDRRLTPIQPVLR